ncbi:MAG: hypothetical protein ABL860_07050 [Candidatus Nitrotoga sp.]
MQDGGIEHCSSGMVGRIVTFIGVGIGLLTIGYFTPVPPGAKSALQS